GWMNYLYGDNKAANALIKRQNPEMTDELLAYSIAKMKEYGIVDSGDATTLGVGAMTDARMQSFYDKMVRAGVVKPSIALAKAYTLQFVNKKVGLDLRPNWPVWGRAMRALLSLAFCVLLAASASAQSFPSRPIRMIVPAPPAGITDLSARLVAEGLRVKFNQPVVVENK